MRKGRTAESRTRETERKGRKIKRKNEGRREKERKRTQGGNETRKRASNVSL